MTVIVIIVLVIIMTIITGETSWERKSIFLYLHYLFQLRL
jgi:hypothetical protein